MTNTVARYNPAVLFPREPFFKLFETLLGNEPGEEIASRTWQPPVDIQETEDAYRLIAELPGLTKDDVAITMENNVLRLSGERKFERDAKKDTFQRIERTYGSFTRSFALPSQVDAEGVTATFADGVLTLTVPKAEQAKPRKIAIS
jgi:HSP20 family protein